MKSFEAIQLYNLKQTYPQINRCILSSVADTNIVLTEALKTECDYYLEFDHNTPVPITNLYESPTTLGLDRLAAAIGGSSIFPGKELLVIDAGTAITYDLIDNNNCFLGGNISPGLKMRFRALHHFTKKLPEMAPADIWPGYGKTTDEAIRAGVQQGMIFEIDGMIEHIRKDWPHCTVILTGGDCFFFDKKLKNTIFVKFELTLIGLNRVLEFNAGIKYNTSVCFRI